MRSKLRDIGYAAFILLALFFTVSIWIYVSAPVDQLRDHVTYTPPFKNFTREVGLGLKDNLQLADMPVDLIMATLVAEDNEFASHTGIRLEKIYERMMLALTTDAPLTGASTLTQQLAKNVFTSANRTFLRKYIELLYTIKIEHNFTKEEIFTLYVNMVQVGPNSYGYTQAAKMYFGKKVSQLTPVESVFIVSNLPSPEIYPLWFIEGGFDDNALQRLVFLLYRETLVRNAIDPFRHVTREQKAEFFSQYLLEEGHGVCVSKAPNEVITETNKRTGKPRKRLVNVNDRTKTMAIKEANRFIKLHYKKKH